jgi:hypothetical protein
VSVDSLGGQGNGDSKDPSISADGRHVAFLSWASNLVRGDTNGLNDVFVHDRLTGATTRVSVQAGGGQGNDYSFYPAISADGHSVGFSSFASNLVPGDTNGLADIFVHDGQCEVGTPYCFGDGSGTACPCANPGAGGEGCANSGGAGGRLAASGSASVAADDLGFDATQLVPGELALLFAGLHATNARGPGRHRPTEDPGSWTARRRGRSGRGRTRIKTGTASWFEGSERKATSRNKHEENAVGYHLIRLRICE